MLNAKIKIVILGVMALIISSGCITNEEQNTIPETTSNQTILKGEVFTVEMPAIPFGTWSTRVYKFTDKDITCYIVPGGVNVNTIACVK